MSAAAPKYLISKALDPVFAISIGVTALILRVRREEEEKGRDPNQAMSVLQRRVNLAWQQTAGGRG